ncbi:hypothetical protein AVEN_183361-1, partial [Araneus ventricosus]
AQYTTDLQWNRVSNLEPFRPKAKTSPLGHRGLFTSHLKPTKKTFAKKASNCFTMPTWISSYAIRPKANEPPSVANCNDDDPLIK